MSCDDCGAEELGVQLILVYAKGEFMWKVDGKFPQVYKGYHAATWQLDCSPSLLG